MPRLPIIAIFFFLFIHIIPAIAKRPIIVFFN
jgi:hypothetical protein